MLVGLLFYACYSLISLATVWASYVIFSAHLSSHPSTRDLGISWLAWPLGIFSGIVWPITIPLFIIIAGCLK